MDLGEGQVVKYARFWEEEYGEGEDGEWGQFGDNKEDEKNNIERQWWQRG